MSNSVSQNKEPNFTHQKLLKSFQATCSAIEHLVLVTLQSNFITFKDIAMSKRLSILFYLKKQKNFTKGAQPIYMRITVDSKRTEISTKRDCEPEKWSSGAGRAKGTKEDTKTLNVQ